MKISSVKKNRVSVIMLAYNHEKYISQAIQSVLSQEDVDDLEIMISDDCSKDNTASIIEQFRLEYPNIIHSFCLKENIGATKNLYNLIMNATGEYLAFLECDDYWTDTKKLVKQIKYLKQNEDVIAVYHKMTVVDENSLPIPDETSMFNEKVFKFEDFQRGKFPGQTATCMCRNFYHDNNDYSVLYKGHRLIGDRTLLMLALEHGEIHVMDENMSAYRKVISLSAGNARSLQHQKNMILEQWEYYNILEQYAVSHQLKVDLNYIKVLTYVQAVYRFLGYRKYEDFLVQLRIWNKSGEKIQYFCFLCRVIFNRILRKLGISKKNAAELYFGKNEIDENE